jgi:chorismate-pyruvate lyase
MTFAPGITNFEIDDLDLLQRILVSTDGTVTDVLAVAFLEPIDLVRMSVTVEPAAAPIDALEVAAGETVMRREIVLRGRESGRSYACARVLIAADRLLPDFRDALLEGRVPLGQLWQSHRVETWKERPRVRGRQAGDLSGFLGVGTTEELIERTYRTYNGGRPVFLVTEFFPRQYRPAVP